MSSARSSGCSGAGRSRRRAGAGSSACTTCPSGCCRPRCSPRRRRRSRRRSATLLRVAARSLGVATEPDLRDYFRLPAADEAAHRRAGRGRRALAGRGRGLARRRPTWIRRPGSRAASTARALVGPFDSLSGSGRARSGSSASATGSRSTCRRRSACTATTCCRSSSATGSSARVDLKADRQGGALRVQAAHAEPDAPPETAAELRAALESMAELARAGADRGGAARRPRAGARRDRRGAGAARRGLARVAGRPGHRDLGALALPARPLVGLARALGRDRGREPVPRGRLAHRIARAAVTRAGAGHQDRARAVADADEGVPRAGAGSAGSPTGAASAPAPRRPRRTRPRARGSPPARPRVVERGALPRLQHVDVDAVLREARVGRLERAERPRAPASRSRAPRPG